jgi:epoxyqueuosine reductase
MTPAASVTREAFALGFQAVGISRVEEIDPMSMSSPPQSDLLSRLLEWLQRGYHGAMAWMERDPMRRADPRQVLRGCRSVISVGMNYYTEQRADERPGHGRIARYAWGEDYHDLLRTRLEQLEERIRDLAPGAVTRSYVDTGPIMEKAWAQRAGLGWIGKHSNLVSPRYGSWLLLGEILTTLDLDPDEPGTDLCGSCTLCIRACPTGAITEPYVVDARRCISYLTIELPRSGQAMPEELHQKLGNRIFGCDDCLDICPYNVNATPTKEQGFQPSPMTLAPPLSRLAIMRESEFAAVFKKSPIRRAKYAGFLRNVILATGLSK